MSDEIIDAATEELASFTERMRETPKDNRSDFAQSRIAMELMVIRHEMRAIRQILRRREKVDGGDF
jgi:hypothetical protein